MPGLLPALGAAGDISQTPHTKILRPDGNGLEHIAVNAEANHTRLDQQCALSPVVLAALTRLSDELDLTPTLQVRLREIGAGLTYSQIARRHAIKVTTVKTQAQQLFHAFGINSRAEIRNAVTAAELRSQQGNLNEIVEFLHLRFE